MKSVALALAFVVSSSACKKETTENEVASEPSAGKRMPSKVVATDAAPPPRPAPLDAAPIPTEVVENPLQFVERGPAKHRRRLAKCPRGKGPCIAGFDFAYFVYDAGWKHYYIIDPGSRDSPLREGNANFNLIKHRMSAAAKAVLKKERKTKALLRCDSADRFHEVAKLDTFVRIDVSAQGAEQPPNVEALKKTTAAGANEAIAAMYAKVQPAPMAAERKPFFSERELASMASAAFARPRVARGAIWIGRETGLTYGRFTVVYSPASDTVYVDTRVDSGDADDVLDDKNLAKFEVEDLARVRALIAQLGLKEIELFVGSLCELGKLGGYGEWISFEI